MYDLSSLGEKSVVPVLYSSTTTLMRLNTQMQHEQHNCDEPPLVSTQDVCDFRHNISAGHLTFWQCSEVNIEALQF